MRPPSLKEPPEKIKEELDGTVILSEVAQDPVCWDNFDAEEIWASAPHRRSSIKGPPGMEEGIRRGSRRDIGSSSGRWQRGVALPPPEQQKKSRDRDAENPSDLWDDPGVAEGAAADFSAFGSMPEDAEDAAFDFEKIAEATAKFEEEFHGSRSRASSTAETTGSEKDEAALAHHETKIDPKRPLAAVGTTIQSGSGDEVNVFEDFDEPGGEEEPEKQPAPTIKAADEDANATSRVMAMIGMKKEEPTSAEAKVSAWSAPEPAVESTKAAESSVLGGIPLNPWGDPILSGQSQQPPQQGLDLQARLREAEQQKAREAEIRRRQEQEAEAQRRALAQQQAAQERARQAASLQQQQQQQAGVQSQVEVVLMERISTILENSWGRSDLVSILTTLHAEDSRVIPLLNNVDSLRALLLRNPKRVALRQDPSLRAEMAQLLMTNAQWQQHQQQEQAQQRHQQQLAQQQQAQRQQAQARAQQEEMQRREQQRRLEEQQAAAARAQQKISMIPGAPWYYSDPQNNIQGPFRAEEMRQWLEAGYFKGDLPISQQPGGPFNLLSAIFPDLSVAFQTPEDKSEEIARAEENARLEAEHAKAEAEAAERERERRAQEAAAKERREKEALEREQRTQEEAARKNGGTAQLKMMLGIPAQGGETPAVEKQSDRSTGKPSEKKSGGKSAQRRSSKEPQVSADEAVGPSAKSVAPAWGGAAASQPATRKSMSEIQKEEARAAAVAAMNREGTRSSSSGWANVAASRGGSTGWSGGAAKQTPAAVMRTSSARAAVPARAMSAKQTNVVATSAKAATQAQKQRSTSATSDSDTAVDAFGAKMPASLEKWCREQMIKLNGSDDLTLLYFCMTLNDPSEIRQYLAAYLGSSPQVNNFATEFINKKGGPKDTQEEWESTATVKKSRKKKSGTR
jgi:hypothetical protein